MKTHTGNKSYKCDLCGIAFIQRTQLKNHMFHHTGQDGVKCPHCDELFDNKSTMNRHISKLHDIKWRCPTCPLTFGTEDDLKSHEEAMHGSHKSEKKRRQKKSQFKQLPEFIKFLPISRIHLRELLLGVPKEVATPGTHCRVHWRSTDRAAHFELLGVWKSVQETRFVGQTPAVAAYE